MANTKSAVKRIRTSKVKAERNASVKSRVRHEVRKVREAVGKESPEATSETFRRAASIIDRAAAKGVLHRKTAARRKSRLARMMNKARSGAPAAGPASAAAAPGAAAGGEARPGGRRTRHTTKAAAKPDAKTSKGTGAAKPARKGARKPPKPRADAGKAE